MPRFVTRRRATRAPVDDTLPVARTSAVARPVDLGPAVAPRNGFQDLAGALVPFNRQLAGHIEDQNKEEQARQEAAGRVSAIRGEALTQDANPWFASEYLKATGELASRRYHTNLVQMWESFDVSAHADPEVALEAQLQRMRQAMGGDLDDPNYAEGFFPGMEQAEADIRKRFRDEMVDDLDRRRRTEAIEWTTNEVGIGGISSDNFTAYREAIRTRYGLSRDEANQALVTAIRGITQQTGDVDLWDFAYEPLRGESGIRLISNPALRDQIINATREAENRFLQIENLRTKRDNELKKERTDAVTAQLTRKVMDVVESGEDREGLLPQLDQALDADLLSETAYMTLRRALLDETDWPSDPNVSASLEIRVRKGEAGQADIYAAYIAKDINRRELSRLLGIQNDTQGGGPTNVFDTDAYRQSLKYINEVLHPSGGLMSGLDNSERQRRAFALSEFDNRVTKLGDLPEADQRKEIELIRDDITKRYSKDIDQGNVRREPRYPAATHDERMRRLIAAVKRGEISEVDALREKRLLDQMKRAERKDYLDDLLQQELQNQSQ